MLIIRERWVRELVSYRDNSIVDVLYDDNQLCTHITNIHVKWSGVSVFTGMLIYWAANSSLVILISYTV